MLAWAEPPTRPVLPAEMKHHALQLAMSLQKDTNRTFGSQ